LSQEKCLSALFTGPGHLAADVGRRTAIPDVMRDLEAEFFVDWQVELSEPFTLSSTAESQSGIFSR
jgi:hypothetical protein